MVTTTSRASPDKVGKVLGILHGEGSAVGETGRRSTNPGTGGERYLLLPTRRHPRMLVPEWGPGTAARVLVSHNGLLRPSRRALRWALAGATVLPGVARWARIAASHGSTNAEALVDHLRGVVGSPQGHVAVGSLAGERRAPVMQVFDDQARPIAFAKIGWDERSGRRVRSEATALSRCAEVNPPHLVVPAVVHQGSWQGLDLLVTTPLPPGVRRIGSRSQPPPPWATMEVASLAPVQRGALGGSSYAASLADRSSAEPGLAALVADTVGTAAAREVRFSAWHGDWVPWNLGWTREGRLAVWDWEHWSSEAPLGFDLLVYFFNRLYARRRAPLLDAFRRASVQSRAPRLVLGQPACAQGLVEALFLLEMVVRDLERGRIVAPVLPPVAQEVHRCLAES
jgi:hypothetical protein